MNNGNEFDGDFDNLVPFFDMNELIDLDLGVNGVNIKDIKIYEVRCYGYDFLLRKSIAEISQTTLYFLAR